MNPVADLGRWSWGGGGSDSALQDSFTANTEPVYLNVEQANKVPLNLCHVVMM